MLEKLYRELLEMVGIMYLLLLIGVVIFSAHITKGAWTPFVVGLSFTILFLCVRFAFSLFENPSPMRVIILMVIILVGYATPDYLKKLSEDRGSKVFVNINQLRYSIAPLFLNNLKETNRRILIMRLIIIEPLTPA